MTIDTTPFYPPPSDPSELDVTIREVAKVFDCIAPDTKVMADFLIRALVPRGFSVAMSMWAVHEVVRRCGLTAYFFRDAPKNLTLVHYDDPPAGLAVDRRRIHIDGGSVDWSDLVFVPVHDRLAELKTSPPGENVSVEETSRASDETKTEIASLEETSGSAETVQDGQADAPSVDAAKIELAKIEQAAKAVLKKHCIDPEHVPRKSLPKMCGLIIMDWMDDAEKEACKVTARNTGMKRTRKTGRKRTRALTGPKARDRWDEEYPHHPLLTETSRMGTNKVYSRVKQAERFLKRHKTRKR